MIDWQKLLESDRQHVWHPYSAVHSDLPVFPIKSAQGVYLTYALQTAARDKADQLLRLKRQQNLARWRADHGAKAKYL